MLVLVFLPLGVISAPRKHYPGEIIVAYADYVKNPFLRTSFIKFSDDYYCKRTNYQKVHFRYSIGDRIIGKKFKDIGLQFSFRKNINFTLCDFKSLNEKKLLFKKLINSNYNLELLVDDIVVNMPFGIFLNNSYFMFSKYEFTFYHNDNVISDVKVTPMTVRNLMSNNVLSVRVTSKWKETLSSREEMKYKKLKIINYHSAHMFSIIYLVVLVIVFCLLLLKINRGIKLDSKTSYDEKQFDDFDFPTNRGWKMVHSDVFRPEKGSSLLFQLVGSGLQFFTIILLYTFINIFTSYDKKHDYEINLFLVLFVVTTLISSFISVYTSNVFGRKKWLRIAFGSSYILPALIIICWICISIIGRKYHSFYCLRIFSFILILLILILPVGLLSIFGGLQAYKKKDIDESGSVALVPRMIPKLPLLLKTFPLSIGFTLLLSPVFLCELSIIFKGIWGNLSYVDYKYLILVLILIVILTFEYSNICTFFGLQKEYYLWQWRTFFIPIPSGAFSFGLSLFIFHEEYLNNLFSTSFFIIVNLVISLVLSMILGSISYLSSLYSLKRLYSNIKSD